MRLRTFLRFLFVEYCVVIGLLLLLLPWSDAWLQVFHQIPQSAVSDLLRNSFLRSAISAFGLVHLLWVLHDVDLFLTQLRQRAEDSVDHSPGFTQDTGFPQENGFPQETGFTHDAGLTQDEES